MTERESMKVKIEIYTSPTCPYCPAALRMLQKAIDIYGNTIEVTKIDISTPDGQELAAFYDVQATPTIIMNGIVKFRGETSESSLYDEIETYLEIDQIKKAAKRRKTQNREIDLMYG